MKTIQSAKFKEQCLSILDRLDPEGVIITKHGRPVAHLTPLKAKSASLIGSLKGKITLSGNILNTEIKWNAES
jgi:antitoxin (DNA-binding transcriptional repressor) of toxin-antitoxin stability system